MSQEERKRWLIIIIKQHLKSELKCAKKGNRHTVEYYQNRLFGILHYAECVKDIDAEMSKKIRNLSCLIKKKY